MLLSNLRKREREREIWVESLCVVGSVTRLGDFWKFLATKLLPKEAQMIDNFFVAILKNLTLM